MRRTSARTTSKAAAPAREWARASGAPWTAVTAGRGGDAGSAQRGAPYRAVLAGARSAPLRTDVAQLRLRELGLDDARGVGVVDEEDAQALRGEGGGDAGAR